MIPIELSSKAMASEKKKDMQDRLELDINGNRPTHKPAQQHCRISLVYHPENGRGETDCDGLRVIMQLLGPLPHHWNCIAGLTNLC
jgi:hypothetical protein